MRFRPASIKLEKDLFTANMFEDMKRGSFSNFATIKLLHLLFPGEKNLSEKSFQFFGFEPVCPGKGKYLIRKKTGEVVNTFFGTRSKPIFNIKKIKKRVINKLLSINQIDVSLVFTGEGIVTDIIID